LHEAPSLALRADVAGTTADPREPESGYYWFVDQAFVGHARAGAPLEWRPRQPGLYVVRVVDAQGRSDAREVRVAAAP
jgi:membrane carboxypeptidase/penicillin-binding protein PbpC